MALKNTAITITYLAWDNTAKAGKTGDSANHTLKIILDGTAGTPTNAPAQVDATNCPGLYSLALTAGETNGNSVCIAGKSSTSGVVIVPTMFTTETAARAGDAMTLTVAYDAAKTAAPVGAAMTLSSAYDAAKTAGQATVLAAVKAKTDLIGASTFTIQSPVAADAEIELIQGDDYAGDEQIVVTKTGYVGPDLTGGTCRLMVRAVEEYEVGPGAAALDIAGTMTLSEGGATVSCAFTLTAVQTVALAGNPPEGRANYVYQVLAVTAAAGGSFNRTLALGSMTVEASATGETLNA